jgi:hypothetical protein
LKEKMTQLCGGCGGNRNAKERNGPKGRDKEEFTKSISVVIDKKAIWEWLSGCCIKRDVYQRRHIRKPPAGVPVPCSQAEGASTQAAKAHSGTVNICCGALVSGIKWHHRPALNG